MDLTKLAAFVGAITGLLSIGWSIYQYWRSKARLWVEATVVNNIFNTNPANVTASKQLVVRVTNLGSRPIMLTGIRYSIGHFKPTLMARLKSVLLSKKESTILPFFEKGMPYTLNEGALYQVTENLEDSDKDLVRIDAMTSTGRVYSNSRTNRREISRQLKRDIQYKSNSVTLQAGDSVHFEK